MIKEHFICLTGSGQPDCLTLKVTGPLQHAVINKENGHKIVLLFIRSGSVRKRFSELFDDGGVYSVGISFVKSDQFFNIYSAVYSVLLNNLDYRDIVPLPFIVHNLVRSHVYLLCSPTGLL